MIAEPPSALLARYWSGRTWMTAVGIARAQRLRMCHRAGRYQCSATASVASRTSRRPEGSSSRSGWWVTPAMSWISGCWPGPGASIQRVTDRKAPALRSSASNSFSSLRRTVITSEVSITRATSSPRSRPGLVTMTRRRASAVASTVASTSTVSGPGRWTRLKGVKIRPMDTCRVAVAVAAGTRRPTAAAGTIRPPRAGFPPGSSSSSDRPASGIASAAASGPATSSADRSGTGASALCWIPGEDSGGSYRAVTSHSTSAISSAVQLGRAAARDRARSSINDRSVRSAGSARPGSELRYPGRPRRSPGIPGPATGRGPGSGLLPAAPRSPR